MTDRIPLDELTSDALDQLYAERDRLRAELDSAYRRHDSLDSLQYALGGGLTHHCARAEKAEAEVERMKLLVAASSEEGHAVRMAAQYAERAIENGERAERAEQLAAELRTQAITEQKRAERAEAERDAAVARLYELGITTADPEPSWQCPDCGGLVPISHRHIHQEAEQRTRAERAEAAIERVRALATQLTTTGVIWDGNDQETARRIHAALDPQEPQP